MTLTANHVETALRSIPGAYGRQITSLDVLASGATEALLSAPAGLTVQGAAAFLATMSQESASLRATEEYAKNGRYAPYIGRTFEMVTWKDNYAAFGAWCHGLPLNHPGYLTDPSAFAAQPKLLADIRWAWLGGVWFWQKNGIWAYANRGDFLATQRAVNLGNPASSATPIGMTARSAWYAAWLAVGADLLPAAPIVPPVVVPPLPAPVPAPTPPEDNVPVDFRGFKTCPCVAASVPLVEREMLRRGLIKNTLDFFQMGYHPGFGPSGGTHDEGGNVDTAQFSDDQIKCWRDCGWTIQHRTKAQGFDMDHGHGWPWGCTHLSPAGNDQAHQWSKRQNGLVSHGLVQGKWPVPNWKTAANNLIAAQKKRDAAAAAAAAEAAKKKELELPTTAEVVKALSTDPTFLAAVASSVLNADLVPNEWADKDADPTVKGSVPNPTISVKTSLRRADKQILATAAKVDALTAAVAAAFPSPTT